jgi:glycosyltransferase involved in cell wall biosynthesis
MSISILHVNYHDTKGGAAIAVQRIHEAQKLSGINSKILVAEKLSTNQEIIGPNSTFEEIKWQIFKSLNRKIEKIQKKKKYDSNSFNILPNNFIKKINKIDCDIVNLHWIGNNLIPIRNISKINKPVVWTLHDMWPYTGSEHYTLTTRFIDGYKKSNKPENLRGFDIEKYCWELKKKHYPKEMLVVPTSEWQLNNVKKSYLLKNLKTEKIALPINFDFWKPLDKTLSRKLLNIPIDKKIILIGSENLSHLRKGFHNIDRILKNINNKDVVVLSFGNNNKLLKSSDSIKYINLNEIKANTSDLKIVYSASDLFIAPSIQESFGQTVLESASCCLPSVCFENNGFSEVIDHEVNGYLAKQNDIIDFSKGIDWSLKNLKRENMEENLINLKKKFSYQKVGDDYKKIYQKLLSIN